MLLQRFWTISSGSRGVGIVFEAFCVSATTYLLGPHELQVVPEKRKRGVERCVFQCCSLSAFFAVQICVIMGTQIEGRRSRERPQSDTRCPWISHRSCSSLCWKSRTSERPWRRIAAIAQSPTYHIRDRCPIVLPLCVEFRNFLTFGLHTGGSARGKNGTDLGTRPASRSRNSGRPPPTGLPLQNYFI